jgi:lysophospholipase L1-like esterase
MLLFVLGLLVAACGSPRSVAAPPAVSQQPARTPSPTPSATPTARGSVYYVSLGDSYAAGYQPIKGSYVGHTSTAGFPYQLAASTLLRGQQLKLVNYACSGVTSGGLLLQQGCLKLLEGPGAPPYPSQTQSQAALAFIRAHRAKVGLVTVSIGGNDVANCARSDDLTSCIRGRLPALKANLATFLTQLRAAAGPKVLIVGTTYPDVLLGGDLSTEPLSRALAPESVAAFYYLLNPTLKAGYDAIGATFVDVTAAAGAYLPSSQTTTLAPYGTIPVSVAKVCQLTYFCELNDIHPRTNGYALIARLIAGVLPK